MRGKTTINQNLTTSLSHYFIYDYCQKEKNVSSCPCPLYPADSDHNWKIGHVPLKVGVKFRYAFQAVRGDPSASAGGIYIDDISLTETRCPNAVWRIRNFTNIMETADINTVIDSPRFYSPEGYGYGVRMMPLSSYTDYTGNYTGLYFHLASGENDAVMQWPAINRQATLVVMDQDPDIKLRMSSARSLTTDMMTSKFSLSVISSGVKTRAGYYHDTKNRQKNNSFRYTCRAVHVIIDCTTL